MRALFAGMLAALMCAAGVTAQARELAESEDQLLRVEVVSVVVVPGIESPAVLLRDPDSGDMLPIFVGVFEALAIERALRGEVPPRPQTHDLALSLLETASVKLKRLVIDELRDDTYFAALEFEREGKKGLLRVDARPSDGMALALRSGIPILVSRSVIEQSQPAGEGRPPGQVIST